MIGGDIREQEIGESRERDQERNQSGKFLVTEDDEYAETADDESKEESVSKEYRKERKRGGGS